MLSTSPHGARRQTPVLASGLRPARIAEPHVVGRVLLYGGEPIEEHMPLVQILDALVPQMEDQVADNLNLDDDVLDVARLTDLPSSEQVIEVPKISCSSCPSRSPIPEPQSAEQSRSSTLQVHVVVAKGVFKVFSQDRVQQRRLLRRNAFLSGLWSSCSQVFCETHF